MCNMNGTSAVARDYFIAGVLGKRETYRTTSGPYYGNPHRNSYAFMVHTPIKSILNGLVF